MNRRLQFLTALSLTASLMLPNAAWADTDFSDIKGHWASQQITEWANKGYINGYSESFRPNEGITRAELAAVINKSFGYTEAAEIQYKDVHKSKWYYNEIAIAKKAGYMIGFQDQTFKHSQKVTRLELAVILTRLLGLKEEAIGKEYTDAAALPVWSKGAVGAVIKQGIMKGNGGRFNPNGWATRAETVVILDRGIEYYNDNPSIELKPDSGNSGNTTPGGGNNGTGPIIVLPGGGGNPITVIGQNTVFAASTIVKGDSLITLNAAPATGLTAWFAPVSTTAFSVGTTMTKLTGNGSSINLSAPKLEGAYRLYLINAQGIVSNASSAVLTVDNTAPTSQNTYFTAGQTVKGNVSVTLTSAPTAGETVWFAPTGTSTFSEDRTMTKLTGNGIVTLIAAPLAEGDYKLYVVDIAGNISSPSNAVLKVINQASTGQNTVFAASRSAKGGSVITLDAPPATGLTAWFAPTGTNSFTVGALMTSLTGNGTDKVIAVPTVEAQYNLYMVDLAGNVSSPSNTVLTVDNTAPTSQNTVFSADQFVNDSNDIILNSAPLAGVTAWFTPAGTTIFAESSTMTRLIGNGSTKIITAPSIEAQYKLYLVDEAGNISNPSTSAFTVDFTAPTNQNTIFGTSQTIKAGQKVTLNAAPTSGITAWFAPAVTTVFTEGPTMSKLSGNGIMVEITAPSTPAVYKLFLVDSSGNVSNVSNASLTVNP